MIRVSEMVLPGHPDKFCDQVADAVIAACVAVDADAYGQVEVSTWSDHVWLSGGICTRRPLPQTLESLVVEAGLAAGYGADNWIDPRRYRVTSTVCQQVGDPTRWSARVNDQSIVLGWAGYDPRTHYLPPEHFLAHVLREALTAACRNGPLKGQGPDGKLMVRLREDSAGWTLEQVLVTLQQREDNPVPGTVRGRRRHAGRRLPGDAGTGPALARTLGGGGPADQPQRPAGERRQRRRQRPDRAQAGDGLLRPARAHRRRRALRQAPLAHRPHRRLRRARRRGARRAVRREGMPRPGRLRPEPGSSRWTSTTRWRAGASASRRRSSFTRRWSIAIRPSRSRRAWPADGISSTCVFRGTGNSRRRISS
jgi:hypothetical protein